MCYHIVIIHLRIRKRGKKMFRPKEGSEELGDWKDPYTRSLVVVQDLKLADKVVWYAYRFPRYFIKNKDYCEDILQDLYPTIH